MTQGWVKYLFDNTCEYGWNSLIANKTASWRRGRQDILNVKLYHNDIEVDFNCGPGQYWQSDRLFSKFEGYNKKSKSEFLTRCLARKVTEADVGSVVTMFVDQTDPLCSAIYHISISSKFDTDTKMQKILPRHKDMWLIATLNVKTGNVTVNFKKRRP